MCAKHKKHSYKVKKVCPNCGGKTRLPVKLWTNLDGEDCYAPVMCVMCRGKGFVYEKKANV